MAKFKQRPFSGTSKLSNSKSIHFRGRQNYQTQKASSFGDKKIISKVKVTAYCMKTF